MLFGDLVTSLGLESVTPYGVGTAVALLATLLAAGVWCAVRKTGYGAFIRMAVLAVPLSLLCARLVFVLGDCMYYINTLSNPALALHFWDGGYAIMGALGGFILAAFLAEKWAGCPRGELLNAVGIAAPVGILLMRLNEAGTGMGLGRVIYTGWMKESAFCAIDDGWGNLVHATYRYEAAVAVLILLALVIWLVVRRGRVSGGDVLLVFLVLFGATQVLLESMRDDGHLVVHFVRIQQVLAIILPVTAQVIWSVRWARLAGTEKGQIILTWLVTAAAIVVGIVQEFAIDSSENLWLDYGIMAAALAAIAAMALWCRRKVLNRAKG